MRRCPSLSQTLSYSFIKIDMNLEVCHSFQGLITTRNAVLSIADGMVGVTSINAVQQAQIAMDRRNVLYGTLLLISDNWTTYNILSSPEQQHNTSIRVACTCYEGCVYNCLSKHYGNPLYVCILSTYFNIKFSVFAFRFLATGDSYESISLLFAVGRSTIPTILYDVLDELLRKLSPIYLKFPSTSGEWKKIAEEFFDRWKFPLCLGAIDGKHIRVSHLEKFELLLNNGLL